MHKLRHHWEALRASFWFLPALMTVLAAAAAVLGIQSDVVIQDRWVRQLDWVYTGSAEGARQLLATVAGSMVTVAGVVFSITVVALSMASSQFGPRLLRNFMRDRGNQVVLGTFIATFVYCLLVLRTVRGQDGREFVPHVSVTLAILLALASLGVLIYFIHHAAVSMQAPQIIANVGAELQASIESLFPEKLGEAREALDPQENEGLSPDFDERSGPVAAAGNGYVQFIENERLMEIATENDLLIRIVHRPGHFVVQGEPVALVGPGHPSEELNAEIRSAFGLGSQQTPTQDIEFIVNQLVEIAVRALSPSVNDPFTALTCLDQLGAALCQLAGRKIPSPYRRDKQGRLRVVAYPLTFADVADASFRQIRHYGRDSAAVIIRMLEVITKVVTCVKRGEDRAALLRHARLIKQIAESLPQEADRTDAARRYVSLFERDSAP